MHNPRCFVLSLDFDGCTDTPSSRQTIIKHVLEVYTQFPSIKKIVVIIGSLRQSLGLDISNALRNSTYPNYVSCTSLMDEMVPRLQALLDNQKPEHGIEIIFDKLLHADIYAELEAGTSFNIMKKVFSLTPPDRFKSIEKTSLKEVVANQLGEDIELFSAPHLTDCSKITLIYGQLHHIATHYTDDLFLMHFYDDRHDILHGIHEFFTSNPQWIPANMTLKLFCHMSMSGAVPLSFRGYLKGHGEPNTYYTRHLIQMAHMLRWNTIPEHFPDLKDYLEEAINPTPLKSSSNAFQHEENEYSVITIPEAFENLEEAILSYQSILEHAKAILNENLQLELELFNEYISTLEHLDDMTELFEATYKKQTIHQKECISKQECLLLNDLDNTFLNYTGYIDDSAREEAQDYAETRCMFDARVESHESSFNDFKHTLILQISSSLSLDGDEFLKRVEIYKNSNVPIIIAPKPVRSTPLMSIFTLDPKSYEANTNPEKENHTHGQGF